MSVPSVLLALLDEAFDHKAWHGTTLFGSIRGLDAAAAARRPAHGRHNIWEIVVHAAYWKYAVRRRLTGEKRATFALTGSNWFVRPEPGAASPRARNAAFKADVRLLAAEHRSLREVVASLSPASLAVRVGQYDRTYLIRGIAAHDLYHAGQIQLLKRLGR
jgi:uncharacterized damage-inducible protein DinB